MTIYASEYRFGCLRGKTAVVTGSSTGIGRAIALSFADAHANVLIHAATNQAAAAKTASEIRDSGRDAQVVMCDFRDGQSAIQKFADACWKWKDSVDILVNNAGVDLLTGDAAEAEFSEKLQALLDIDVTATMLLSREMVARMSSGTIINIGWDQAATGMDGDSGQLFAAAKAAVMAFTKSLAKTVAPDIRVNCIAPGWIKTAWGDQASQAWGQRAIGEALVGRWGEPQDVANVARFLASASAAFINGQVIDVNGGFRNHC